MNFSDKAGEIGGNMYHALKHTHLLFLALSVFLFVVRFGLLMAKSQWLEKKWLKVVPHLIDTALLTTGIALIGITGFMPFTEHSMWMTEKLACVLAYFALGFVALRYSHGILFKLFAFLGALGWLYVAAKLAITKTPLLSG